jgi:hypothetical protein
MRVKSLDPSLPPFYNMFRVYNAFCPGASTQRSGASIEAHDEKAGRDRRRQRPIEAAADRPRAVPKEDIHARNGWIASPPLAGAHDLEMMN